MSASAARILVIDDSPAIHQDFRKIFDAGGGHAAPSTAEVALFGDDVERRAAPHFEVDSAFQGQEGLALAGKALEKRSSYAVAFVDVRMPPGWDGIETTARLWQQDPDIQVVLCTAYSDYSWNEMLARLGRSDRLVILKKPFDTIEVLQLASSLTEKWQLAKQSRSNLEDLELRVAERTLDLVTSGMRLKASEAQYRLMFEGNPHPMWVYDLETLRFAAVNSAALEHYGYSKDEFLAMTMRDIRPAEDVAALDPRVDELLGDGKSVGVWRHCKRDRSLIEVEISSDRIVFNGRPARLILAHDVTEQRQSAAAMKRLNRVYAMLSSINTLIVHVRNREELFRESCRIAVEAGGFQMSLLALLDRGTMKVVPVASAGKDSELLASIQDALSSTAAPKTMAARAMKEKSAIVSNDSQNDPQVFFQKHYADSGIRSIAVLPLLVSDEAVGVLALYASEIDFFHAGELKLLAGLADDVAFAIDHLDKQEQLDYLALYDPLTGLANRRLLLERVAQYMRSAAAAGHKVALFLIDLERFKSVNDSFGRVAGDALLKQVAESLTHTFGDANLLARIGADHFAVVLPEVLHAARLLEQSLKTFLEHPFRLDESVFRVAAKAGGALFPEDGSDAETLFKHAEAALKTAKARGARYLFYTHAMTDAVAAKLTLENQLRQALGRGEFELRYAPAVSLATGKVTGAEACVWWNDPRTGAVPPHEFALVLEETGLVHEVGRWALRHAIADYLHWRSSGLTAVRISLNVSPQQLRSNGFVAEIAEAIEVDPQAAGGLELAIAESLVMEDVKHSMAIMQAMRERRVTIAIDDFGTGFSSLSYLAKLPADRLKIDRSFIAQMTAGPQGLALVSTLIKLAHSLKLEVTAEGVETEEQSTLLRLLSCNEMQGPLPGKSVPGDVFAARFLAVPGA